MHRPARPRPGRPTLRLVEPDPACAVCGARGRPLYLTRLGRACDPCFDVALAALRNLPPGK